jgi:hypothetical protein
MKRVLIVGAMIVMLVAAASAQAGVRTYAGTAIAGGDKGKFAFKGEFAGGSPVRVKRFRWTEVPVHCGTGGDTVASGHFKFAMAVQSRRFHGTASNGIGGHAHAEGRFRQQDERGAGTFRVHGRLGSGFSGCDTGTVYWHVHRV